MSRAARFTKTNITAGIIAIALVAIPGGAWLANRSGGESGQSTQNNQEVASARQDKQQKQSNSFTYQGETGKNALELLKANADVQTETSDFGEMVTSINGQAGGGDKYWAFFVNGEMSSVGAADYATKDSETIEWKLQ